MPHVKDDWVDEEQFTHDDENAIAGLVNDHDDKLATVATGATANSSDATLLARANHTGTQSADTIVDGSTNKAYTATEKAKLAGVATGATANDTDANLKARANHTGTQTSSTISDLTEAVQDIVGALLSGTTGVTVNYNDAANTLTISGLGDSSATAETIRDTIGIALAGTGLISVTANDALDTITITTTATANDTDANLKNRANHTGTQSADTITDGSTNKAYSATEKTKLAGIATGATANSSDATLLNRANHTGTMPVSALGTGKVVGSDNGTDTSLILWKGTQAQYDALGAGRPSTTVYVVTP